MPPLTEHEREQRLDVVLASYLQALKEGAAPGRQELLDSHPELAEELAAFFADQDRFDRLAAPLRSLIPAASRLGNIRDFGDYEIIEEIARGGMGVVFKAWQKSLGRIVALKMLLAGPWASAADLQRFRTEAESAAQLDHPNIVPIHEVGTHDGHPYLSMKLVEGGSLAQHLAANDRRPSDREAAALLATVADAIHYAHQHGILHRDLKPANVLLANGRRQPANAGRSPTWFDLIPLLTDFGLAKRASRLGQPAANGITNTATLPLPPALTHTGAIVGTPSYMAPEQAAGTPANVTIAADVYGLGAILYEMLTGHPPFKGASVLDTIRQVLEQEPIRPSAYNPALDRDLETICLKCLQKQPRQRYASAGELADDLRRFQRGQPILARPISLPARLWRLARRQPVIAALTLTLTLVALGGVSSVVALWRLAEEHARVVERQRDEVELARQQAENNRRDAERHLRDSENNFQLAHQAVDNYCRRVSEALHDVPQLQTLRKSLLKDALIYYKNFLERRQHDPALRRELAETYRQIARVSNDIGARVDARAAHEQAAAIYRELQRADPDNVEIQKQLVGYLNDAATYQERTEAVLLHLTGAYRLYLDFLKSHPRDWDLRVGLSLTCGNLGQACQQLGRMAEARDWLRQAQQMQEQLLTEKPDNRTLQSYFAATLVNYAAFRNREHDGRSDAAAALERACQLRETLAHAAPNDADAQAKRAAVLENLANLLRSTSRDADACKACQLAFNIRRDLAKNHPHVVRYQSDLAASHRLLGFQNHDHKHFEDALKHHHKAREIQENLLLLNPSSSILRRELSWSHFNIAALHGILNQRPQEWESYQNALHLNESLVRDDPDNLDYRDQLANTLNNLGWNRLAVHRSDDAATWVRQGMEQARALVRRAGGIPKYRETLARTLSTLAEVEVSRGHTRAAADLVRERQRLKRDDAEAQVRAARDLAILAGKTSDKSEREAELHDALDALRQAVARGFHDAARLQNDKIFDPLRSNDEFRRLIGEMKKQTPIPKK